MKPADKDTFQRGQVPCTGKAGTFLPQKRKKLAARQRLFIGEYLIDLNATKTAERAGYSRKTAQSQGARLLTNAMVSAAIQEAMDKRAEKLEITAERVLAEIAKCAFINMGDFLRIDPASGRAFIDLSRATPEQLAALSAFEQEEWVERAGEGRGNFKAVRKIRLKLTDKLGTLEKLGKHLKLFTDKCELTGKDGGPLVHQPAVERMTDEELYRELEHILGTASHSEAE